MLASKMLNIDFVDNVFCCWAPRGSK